MSGDDRRGTGTYASPPCFAHEVDPAYFDPAGVDPQQAADVARWRKAERKRLRAERAAMSVAARSRLAEALAGFLDALLAERGRSSGGWCRPIGRSRASRTCAAGSRRSTRRGR